MLKYITLKTMACFVTLFFILISLDSSLCPSTLGGLYGYAGLLSGDEVGKNMACMSVVK